MIVYKRRKHIFFTYWTLLNIILLAFMGISILRGHRLPGASYLIAINLALIVMQVSHNSLRSLSIQPQQSTVDIEINRWFIITDTYKCKLSELDVTFEKESAGRLGKRNTFKLFIDDEPLVSVVAGYSGWDEGTLIKIVDDINERKKYFEP